MVKISMDIGKSHEIIKSLNQHEIDFLVMADNILFDPKEYTSSTFLIDPLVLICPKSHSLSEKKSCTISEVLNEVFLIKSEHSSTHRFLLEKFKNNFEHKTTIDNIEINSTEGIKQAVIHELGISIVSNLSVEQEVNAGLLCKLTIDDINLERGVRYIYHKDKYLSPATYNFLNLLDKFSQQ
ncbi:LysR substrate-binding domain-containing protein [Klebsiella quasipneumoniae]|uniref:LysR substrate-binding domain-containing protein n=2 Tax=Klebsiella pneumoniae complex TaxID=3390273 RepID=UPI003B887624